MRGLFHSQDAGFVLAIISLTPQAPYVGSEPRAATDSVSAAGALELVAIPSLKNGDRIHLNIDMVRAGVAALSEWDHEQEQEELIVIEIFYRMLEKALIQAIPTSS